MIIVLLIIAVAVLFFWYGSRATKKELESERIFASFDDSIHRTASQQIRIEKAIEENLHFKTILSNGYSGKIVGTSGRTYLVTLKNCSCPDFKETQKPCKHMYRLAIDTHRAEFFKEGNLYIARRIKNDTEYVVRKTESDTEYVVQKTRSDTGAFKRDNKFCDNMNYMVFEGDGLFLETGKRRKIHIEAFSEEEARLSLAESGYDPASLNISRAQFEPPTERQIAAMQAHKNKIPQNACKDDISFLMTKIIEEQREPDKRLIQFATEQKVMFSYFTGEKSLYSCIWNTFDTNRKAAFYLLCVKKDMTGRWEFDSWENYLQKASVLLSDLKFRNSFKRYLNSGFYGFTEETVSRDTNCYKIARESV